MRINFLDFQKIISSNIFSVNDVYKFFGQKKDYWVRQKLWRYLKKGFIFKIKKGLYCFDKEKINPLVLANLLYQPSYISCQSALFYYGVIPDVSQSITSVTTTTTKNIKTNFGNFIYYKFKKELFFGYQALKINDSFLKIAYLEKALLDFFYLNKIKSIDDLRLDLSKLNYDRYKKYSHMFPYWVQRINLES